MAKRRLLGRLGLPAVILSWLAAPASADGLSRFEQALKADPPPAGAFTYKSGKGLGDNGFVLEGVVITPPPDATQGAKTAPIEIARVSVEDFDFASVDKKQPPNFLRLRAEGIAIGGKPAEGIDLAQLAGIDKLAADFQLDYRLDPDRKTMTLNRLELDLNGLARFELAMILDGVTPEAVGKPDAAMNDVSLRTATFVFEDRSLLSKALPAAAKLQSLEPAALIAVGKAMLDGMRAGQGAATLAALDAVASYMEDYQKPKGPLRITVNPPNKTSAATLSAISKPDDAVAALGLVVSYAGTRPQAAPSTAAPASAPASGSAAAKAGCKPGARFFVMHEEAWWAATVREPARSGDQCVARIDGGSADDEVTFAPDKTLAWSIDGPGKAYAKCSNGDKVLVESDGGWYPAKVTSKSAASGKCAIKFETSDEEEETVEMKRVRRLD